MIPGLASTPPSRSGLRLNTRTAASSACTEERAVHSSHAASLARLFLPHPAGDAIALYRAVAADLLVLGTVGGVQTRLLPGLSFPEIALPVFVVLVTLLAFTEGAYGSTPDPFPAGSVAVLARSVMLAALLVFLTEWDQTRLMTIPVTALASLSGLLLYRQTRHFVWARQKQQAELRRVLIVGAGPVAHSLARALRVDPSQRIVVRGFVADSPSCSPGVLGGLADIDWLARAEFIDEVILALPGQPAKIRQAAEVALRNHLDIRAVPDLPLGPWPDATVAHIGEVPVITLHREPIPSLGLLLKRKFDIAAAALGLIAAAPLMALIAFLIRLDSRGPILYAAERTGAKGRRFRCYKFRSMVSGADFLKENLRAQNQRQGPIFKIVGDPRITRVGRILRRYSLDELPQLWNVLRGEMSLVGPRPHPLDDVNRYQLHHYRRLDVKPGITGLWQITARHSPSFDLNMHLDLTYIENWSLRLDLEILLKTLHVLFAPEGA
jgi:exopolysaccharide biosynthesis polyprenyl glycosylphosphotransferase